MSLAVAEKRPQQRNAGGCVGVFFQLFSKKNLFSNKKLLPPPPAKKFGADDKMPVAKLLLIADENKGGYPKLEREPGPDLENRMQAPGLVARLMGLESMPVVHSEKPRKALDSKFCGDASFEHSRLDQELCVDVGGNGLGELRPQKLQKTGRGFLERRPVEAFRKGLIYGSRRKQHMKLERPVKSPRLLSRSSTSRLVQVASKILEPGLQSKSRSKCSITYLGYLEDDREGGRERLSDSVAGSCKSHGSSVGVKESLAAECWSSASLSCGSEENKKIKSTVIPSGQRKNGSVAFQSKFKAEEVYKMKTPVVQGRQTKIGSLVIQAKLNVEGGARDLIERKKHSASVGDPCGKSVARKSNLRRPTQLLPVKDKMVAGNKMCSVKQTDKNRNELNRAKNFVTLKKNVNNYARSRLPTKVSGSCRGELERDRWEKNLARKRSPTNRNAQAFDSIFVKERSGRSNMMRRKGTGLNSNQSINQSCIRSNLPKIDCDGFTESNSNGIVSFTFNSPMRCNSSSTTHEEMARERRGQSDLKCNANHSKKLMSNAKIRSVSSQKEMAFRGDELSNLLEEKIKELSSLDGDELASGDDLQGRSTVSILEELISALTVGNPELHKNGDSCSDVSVRTEITASRNQMSNADEEFQEKIQPSIAAAYLAGSSEQPSPESILEASFSNDSCSLGSFNGSSGSKLQLGLPEMCHNTQSADMDSDLLDSASSLSISQSRNKTMSMCEVGDAETGLGTAVEVISDAELLFENISLYGPDKTPESSLDSFLLDTLESIIDVFFLNFKPAEEGYHQREFLFDCIMECLDSKFSHFCRSGFRTWLKLPSILNRDRLMREVHVEISGWRELAGKAMDDLVEKEMKGSNLKWTECVSEAFETGVEIQTDILQALIDEMVIDLR